MGAEARECAPKTCQPRTIARSAARSRQNGTGLAKRQAAGPLPAARFSTRPRNGQAARTANAIPTNEAPARTGSPFCLVEQGYGVCGARDERAHAAQQQQLVDQLVHDVLPRSGSGKTTTGSRNFGSAMTCGPGASLRSHTAGCTAERRAHSITSSARASSVAGTSSPSALAVLRLMTNSYLVGACTGRSAGFSPLRMRST
jgi:hypothetical protein